MPRPIKVDIPDEMYEHGGVKERIDEAAKAHYRLTKYEKDPYMYTWYFRTEEDAKPLNDLIEVMEEEYA